MFTLVTENIDMNCLLHLRELKVMSLGSFRFEYEHKTEYTYNFEFKASHIPKAVLTVVDRKITKRRL